MVSAYILIQTDLGAAAEVAAAAKRIPGVSAADDVAGPYDVIVQASAENVDQLGRQVVAALQATPGITRTLTCPVINL
ncbi:MAG: Lrp/AsnC ligand binding domain-containing protein [Nitriliruptoraceae bacterium]